MTVNSILNAAETSFTSNGFIKAIDEMNARETEMLLDDISRVTSKSQTYIVLVHPDDSAEAHSVMSDDEIVELANAGTRFFRFRVVESDIK